MRVSGTQRAADDLTFGSFEGPFSASALTDSHPLSPFRKRTASRRSMLRKTDERPPLATNAVTDSVKPTRRSTRVDCSIPMVVSGVDAWRGPYTENVSTVTINAHGCKYASAHQVLNDSVVILEFHGDRSKTARSARGRVKYVKRPSNSGQMFETAIELEHPGNVWGLDQPPRDWAPFVASKQIELDTSKHKPFTLPGAQANAGGLQQQIEKVLSDAAAVIVQEKTDAVFESLRTRIDEEVRKIVSE